MMHRHDELHVLPSDRLRKQIGEIQFGPLSTLFHSLTLLFQRKTVVVFGHESCNLPCGIKVAIPQDRVPARRSQPWRELAEFPALVVLAENEIMMCQSP